MHSWPKVEIEKHITWNNIHSFPNWKDMEELKNLKEQMKKVESISIILKFYVIFIIT